MRIGVIGINHKSAELAWREQLAKAMHKRFGVGLCAHPSMTYVLLSTCNRTELYFCSRDVAHTHTYLLSLLRRELSGEFEHKLYSYFGYDCFFHLSCVTAGMDSAMVGETEIQGQVKLAYESAMTYRSLASELHFLFQKCLKIGKEIRSSIALGRGMPTIEEAVFSMSTHLFGDIRHRKVLFVGVSEINRKIFKRFRQRGVGEVTFCNRSQQKAKDMAASEGLKWVTWENLAHWPRYDIAIFGTKAPNFVISKHPCSLSDKKLVIDLSVPRNVDPRLGRHPAVTLLNVDQLQRAIDRKQRAKAMQIARIEGEVIAQAVEKQVRIFKSKEQQRSLALVSSF